MREETKIKLQIKWQLGMELKSVTEDVKKLEVSGECTKFLYEEDKHEKTTLKVTVECNFNTSRKTLSKVQVHLKQLKALPQLDFLMCDVDKKKFWTQIKKSGS